MTPTEKALVKAALRVKVQRDALLAAAKPVLEMMIPGMNWTDGIGTHLKDALREAIKKAEQP